MPEEKVYTNAIATLLIIGLSLFGLFGSFALLKKDIIPYSGNRFYKVYDHKSDSNKVILVDSLRLAKAYKIKEVNYGPGIELQRYQLTLNHNPALMVWLMTMSMMVATAFGLALPLANEIRKLILTYKPSLPWLIGIVSFSMVIGTVMSLLGQGEAAPLMSAFEIISSFKVLLKSSDSIKGMLYLTVGVGIIGVAGMIVVNFCVSQLHNMYITDARKLAGIFASLNGALRFFLASISILILYSIITTALVQRSLDGVMKVKQFAIFPSEFIYAYGLMFTIFLAIIYLPIHYHMKMEGNRIMEILRARNTDDEDLKKFNIKESTQKSIQVFLSILAPLLGSVFTDLLKHLSP